MITAPAIVQAAPVAHPTATGAALGRLIIPRLHLDVEFRQGIRQSVLADGPGHYPTSALPGNGRVVGIAGHRVTHTHPFLRLNTLQKNDRVALVVGGREYVYRVYRMRIVPQQQVWPFRDGGRERLVLTTCHPPRTASYRLVVFARLVTPAAHRATAPRPVRDQPVAPKPKPKPDRHASWGWLEKSLLAAAVVVATVVVVVIAQLAVRR